jgi:hypothetical protein
MGRVLARRVVLDGKLVIWDEPAGRNSFEPGEESDGDRRVAVEDGLERVVRADFGRARRPEQVAKRLVGSIDRHTK